MQIPPSFPVGNIRRPCSQARPSQSNTAALQNQTKPGAQDRLQTHHLPLKNTDTG